MSTSRQKQAAAVNDSPSDVGGYPPLTAGTPPVDDWEVRLQAYESVFAGAVRAYLRTLRYLAFGFAWFGVRQTLVGAGGWRLGSTNRHDENTQVAGR